MRLTCQDVNTLSGASRPRRSKVQLCANCRREFLPQLTLPNWRREVHRAPAKGMKKELDKLERRAEKIRERKAKGRHLRGLIRSGDFLGAVKFSGITRMADVPSEECSACQRLQDRSA